MPVFRAVYVSLIVLAGGGTARADGATRAPPTASLGSSIAIGSNLPLMWTDGFSVAGSLSVSLSARHALRVNVASFRYDDVLDDLFAGLAGGDAISRNGRTTDVSLSWVFYPRRMWDGFLVEIGALRRATDITTIGDEDLDAFAFSERRTTTYAGRMMIGWSWRIDRHFFIAAALGLSSGWESGTEQDRDADRTVRMTTPIRQQAGSGEGYLRFGGVIDL